VTALAYEIDGKLTIDQVNARVAATGREALVWTTHNHLRTSQPIRVSTFSKWQQRTFGSTRAPTNEDVARFCHENKRYGHLKGVRLKNGGMVCQVREYGQKVEVFDIAHDPEHETRIVFPLKTPFDLRTGGISKARYKDHYHAFGREVFGAAYSPESANPARLHYGPSMPVEGTGIVRRHEGTLLVPEDIDISKVVAADKPNNPRRASLKLQAVGLDELQFLLEHIPPDLEYPDWFRAIAAIFHEARGSDEGNQLAHEWSNGDPRYDFDQVEGIWDSLTPDHERPATIGTLRKLAGEHDPSSMSKYHGLKSMKLFAVYMEVNHEH